MAKSVFMQLKNRILQHGARFLPGANSLRPKFHKWRGVQIRGDVWIGYDAVIETEYPELVSIGDGASIGIRATVIAHYHELRGVRIMQGAYIGPGAIILPNVTVGEYSVVMAGSVVSRSVPPRTVVQGNPAKPVAECRISLKSGTTLKEFAKNLRPIASKGVP